MTKKAALDWFSKNWHAGIVGTPGAADLLSIKLNTFQTRLATKQALANQDRAGPVRRRVSMTGRHLAYNLLNDRLLRHGLFASDDTLFKMTDWILDHVIEGEQNTETVFVGRIENSEVVVLAFDDRTQVPDFGDAVVLIPIGRLILLVAAKLYNKLSEDAAQRIMAEAEAVR